MKKKLIFAFVLMMIIVFSFVGCRNYKFGTSSGATSKGTNFTSQVSGIVSGVASDGRSFGNQVSGVVSGVVSGGQAFGNQVSGVVSGMTSSMKP